MSEDKDPRDVLPKNQVRRPREGFKDVSDRMGIFVRVGPATSTTFGRKRKPLLEETNG